MGLPDAPASDAPSGFLASLRPGVLVALAVFVLAIPPNHRVPNTPSERTAQPSAPDGEQRGTAVAPPERQAAAAKPRPAVVHRYADFRQVNASVDARHIANWALYSGDHEGKAVVIVDKRDARVFVFSPEGRLISSTPALLGSAVGDHTVPGVGEKPLSQVRPEERTTPAGRFIAEPGFNMKGEDIVWVDYDAAVSMHRVRPTVKSERRLERLASSTAADNRISFGCINLPAVFYEQVLSPTVQKVGAVIYVLPEVQSVQALFGSYDVPVQSVLARR